MAPVRAGVLPRAISGKRPPTPVEARSFWHAILLWITLLSPLTVARVASLARRSSLARCHSGPLLRQGVGDERCHGK